MIRKQNTLAKSGIMLVLVILLANVVLAFGVSSPVWEGRPLSISPGETKVIKLSLQNMVGDEDLTIRASLSEGFVIATMEEKDYLVKAGTKDTEIIVTVTIPEDVEIGTEYTLVASFRTVTSGGGGGVVLGINIGTNMDILVVPEEGDVAEEPEEVTSSPLMTLAIIAIILLIIIYLLLRRKKK